MPIRYDVIRPGTSRVLHTQSKKQALRLVESERRIWGPEVTFRPHIGRRRIK